MRIVHFIIRKTHVDATKPAIMTAPNVPSKVVGIAESMFNIRRLIGSS